jgi:Family of unknown function (DUF6328)
MSEQMSTERPASEDPPSGDEDDKARIDRELGELLDEIRVVIPGAEVLFAFLLGVAFTERFSDVTTLQRNVYFATLLVTAAATALLIAPTAYHRLHFRDGTRDKEQMLFTVSHLALGSLVMLLFAVTGVVFLVADVIYAARPAALFGSFIAAWFVWFWFGLPFLRRVKN